MSKPLVTRTTGCVEQPGTRGWGGPERRRVVWSPPTPQSPLKTLVHTNRCLSHLRAALCPPTSYVTSTITKPPGTEPTSLGRTRNNGGMARNEVGEPAGEGMCSRITVWSGSPQETPRPMLCSSPSQTIKIKRRNVCVMTRSIMAIRDLL